MVRGQHRSYMANQQIISRETEMAGRGASEAGNVDSAERKRRKRTMRKHIHSQAARHIDNKIKREHKDGLGETKEETTPNFGNMTARQGNVGIDQSGIMAFYHRGKERGATHELLSLFEEYLEMLAKEDKANGVVSKAPVRGPAEPYEEFDVTSGLTIVPEKGEDCEQEDSTHGPSENVVEVNKEKIDTYSDEEDYDDLDKAFAKERVQAKNSKNGLSNKFTRVQIDMDCVMFFKAEKIVSDENIAKNSEDDKEQTEDATRPTNDDETADVQETSEETPKDSNEEQDSTVKSTNAASNENAIESVKFGPNHHTVIGDPSTFVHQMITWLKTSKQLRTRFTLRLHPVVRTCKASLNDIEKAIKETLDVELLKKIRTDTRDQNRSSLEGENKEEVEKKPTLTYAVQPHIRYNSKLDRDEVIQRIGKTLTGCEVNLKKPDVLIIVHVIRNICFLGYAYGYHNLAKYNISMVRDLK